MTSTAVDRASDLLIYYLPPPLRRAPFEYAPFETMPVDVADSEWLSPPQAQSAGLGAFALSPGLACARLARQRMDCEIAVGRGPFQ